MRGLSTKLVTIGFVSLMASVSAASIASAGIVARVILPPHESALLQTYAGRPPLGNVGPYGGPAKPGCTWSSMQEPTAAGLRWIAEEHCDSNRD